jgi:uncharacterized protein (TIGR02246 family)
VVPSCGAECLVVEGLVDQEVRNLLDRIEIRELTARYGRYFDDGDTEAFADTFTEDGSMEVANGPTSHGRDELRSMCKNTPWGTMHVTVDPTIEIDGDRAVQVVSILVVKRAADLKEKSAVVGSGRYVDDLLRTPDGWRFTRRRVTLDGWNSK